MGSLLDKIQSYKEYLYRRYNTNPNTGEGLINRRAIEIGVNDQRREVIRLSALGLTEAEIIEESGFAFEENTGK